MLILPIFLYSKLFYGFFDTLSLIMYYEKHARKSYFGVFGDHFTKLSLFVSCQQMSVSVFRSQIPLTAPILS